jgi:hypothetical protein
MKEKFNYYYPIRCTIPVLYEMISTPWGLGQWFADNVTIEQKETFVFHWESWIEKADLVAKKDQNFVRFHWVEDENPKNYFELKIDIDELTHEIALEITDFFTNEEEPDAHEIWNMQIEKLKKTVGAL